MPSLARRLDLLVLMDDDFSAAPVNGLPLPRLVLHFRQRVAARRALFLLDVIAVPATTTAAYMRDFVVLPERRSTL